MSFPPWREKMASAETGRDIIKRSPTFYTAFFGIICVLSNVPCGVSASNNATNIYSSAAGSRGLSNEPQISFQSSTSAAPSSCVEARIRCALRKGCGTALQSYMLYCAELMAGRVDYCDEDCTMSLIALTSTEEGAQLMDCSCSDDLCKDMKRRVEVCRADVLLANAKDSIVSCNIAQQICFVDTQCATALLYYDKFCRKMFVGKGCSHRCNNSISILKRQQKAAKLSTCQCDGTENFHCSAIKKNMALLCFPRQEEEEEDPRPGEEDGETNEIDTSSKNLKKAKSSSAGCISSSLLQGLSSRVLRITLHNFIPSGVVRWRDPIRMAFVVGVFELLL